MALNFEVAIRAAEERKECAVMCYSEEEVIQVVREANALFEIPIQREPEDMWRDVGAKRGEIAISLGIYKRHIISFGDRATYSPGSCWGRYEIIEFENLTIPELDIDESDQSFDFLFGGIVNG